MLDGAAGLALAALLIALAPFSRRLSRRLLIGGGLVIGWMPLLWWLPAPGHGIGWVTPALAMSAGALAAWPFSGAVPHDGLDSWCLVSPPWTRFRHSRSPWGSGRRGHS